MTRTLRLTPRGFSLPRLARFTIGTVAACTAAPLAFAFLTPAMGAASALGTVVVASTVAGLVGGLAMPEGRGRWTSSLLGAASSGLAATLVGLACAATLVWGPDPLFFPLTVREAALQAALAVAVPAVPLGALHGTFYGRTKAGEAWEPPAANVPQSPLT